MLLQYFSLWRNFLFKTCWNISWVSVSDLLFLMLFSYKFLYGLYIYFFEGPSQFQDFIMINMVFCWSERPISKFSDNLEKLRLSDHNGIWTHNHLGCNRTLNHLGSLGKWLTVHLWTKWPWVRILLQSDKLQVSHLFWVRSSLTLRRLQSVHSL